VGTLAGAESCNKKLLVIVSAAAACFAGSATLCAVTTAADGLGKICGAVKLPLLSTAPHPEEHAAPETLQRTEVSGWPLLEIAA
jgi:hypothetical protein